MGKISLEQHHEGWHRALCSVFWMIFLMSSKAAVSTSMQVI